MSQPFLSFFLSFFSSFFFCTKWWSYSVEGLLSTGPTLSSFLIRIQKNSFPILPRFCPITIYSTFYHGAPSIWLYQLFFKPNSQKIFIWSFIHKPEFIDFVEFKIFTDLFKFTAMQSCWTSNELILPFGGVTWYWHLEGSVVSRATMSSFHTSWFKGIFFRYLYLPVQYPSSGQYNMFTQGEFSNSKITQSKTITSIELESGGKSQTITDKYQHYHFCVHSNCISPDTGDLDSRIINAFNDENPLNWTLSYSRTNESGQEINYRVQGIIRHLENS